ncbi:hypothetical protein BH759_20335 [Ralstonia solanacearum]|nr:hypothetical protein BH759_20335 [Ralstonia solanacearum]
MNTIQAICFALMVRALISAGRTSTQRTACVLVMNTIQAICFALMVRALISAGRTSTQRRERAC